MLLSFIFALVTTCTAEEIVWDRKAGTWISPDQMAAKVQTGEIVVFGEQHATGADMDEPGMRRHHDNQLRFIRALQGAAVGLEFFPFTAQAGMNSFVAGTLPENEFKTLVHWSGGAWPVYREKIFAGHPAVALNIPRRLSGKIAKHGPNSLSSWEAAWLPPKWERGSATYFERFNETMSGHVSPEKIERYFWAQSLWDDTMAWNASTFVKAYPHEKLVVIVGEFHAEFRDGLAARLRAHGAKKVSVLIQEQVEAWDMSALAKRAAPDKKYGARADYIWFWKLDAPSSPIRDHRTKESALRGLLAPFKLLE